MEPWLHYERIPTTAHGPRRGVEIDTVVWHWTGGWREAEAVAKIDYRRKRNRVSAHFTIGRDGTVIQSVPLNRAAWHAGGAKFLPEWARRVGGEGTWQIRGGVSGGPTNDRSVGIEICNRGFLRGDDYERLREFKTANHRNPAARKKHWERYTQAQHDAIARLARELETAIPTLRYHTGHEDVLNRQHTKGAKLDPGPAFPWDLLGSKQTHVVRWDYDTRDWLHVMPEEK